MLNEIGTVDNIPEFIEGVKNRYLLPVGNYPSVYLLTGYNGLLYMQYVLEVYFF